MSKQQKNENMGVPLRTTSIQSFDKQPLFRKANYILVGVGVLFLVLGYILLSGGGSDDPEVFSPAIYNTRRLVVAPILMLIGLIIPIAAIMYRPKK